MIFGVAAGLGDYFRIDPIIVRIVFVLLAVTGGAGVLLYVLAALLMPGDRGEPPAVHDLVQRIEHARRPRWIGAALIVIAIALLAGNVHSADGTIFWGLALIAIGVLLFQQEGMAWERPGGPFSRTWREHAPEGAAPAAGTGAPDIAAAAGPAAPQAASSWNQPGTPMPPEAGTWAPSSAWAAPQRWHDHRARHHGPPVGWITVALSLVAVGVAVLLSNAGVITLTVGAALAVVLAVIGAGLVVSAFTGRSWGLIVLGILLLPVVATAGVVDEPLSGGVGDRTEVPGAAQDVQRNYELGMGQLTIDLTQAHLGASPTRVHATVAFGQLVVLVPWDLPVVVHGHAGAGNLDLVGRTAGGVRITEDARDAGTTSENALTLDLSVGLGQVRVERSGAGTP